MASESVPLLLDKDSEDSEETELLSTTTSLGGRVPDYSRNINFCILYTISFFFGRKMHVFGANICSPLKYDRVTFFLLTK